MTKLNTPLLSLGAHGSIGNALTFQRRSGVDFVRQKPKPDDPFSDRQRWHRFIYKDECGAWHQLPIATRQQYETDARPHRITGFNLFMRQRLNLASALELYLPLAEGQGISVEDYSPHSRDGVIFGASWLSAYPGGSLSYDGINDSLEVPGFNGLSFTSFSFWVMAYIPPFTGAARYIASWYSIGPLRFEIACHAGANNFYVYLRIGAVTTQWVLAFAPNTWVQAGISWNGATAYLLINGVLSTPKSISGIFNPAVDLEYGRVRLLSPFDGRTGESKFYNRAITELEAEHDYLAVNYKY